LLKMYHQYEKNRQKAEVLQNSALCQFVETFVLAFSTVKVGQGFLHLTMCTKMQVDNPVIFF